MQKGSAIYFAIVITSLIMAIALGLSTLLLGGFGILQGSVKSAIAFYAAEAGVEHILFEDKTCAGDINCLQIAAASWGLGGVVTLSNQATYSVDVKDPGDCVGAPFCALSTGIFQNVARTIEVTRQIFLLPCGEEIDVALALDMSDSIDDSDLVALKDAVSTGPVNFIDILDPTPAGTHMSVVIFQNLATIVEHLTGNNSNLHTTVDSLGFGGPPPSGFGGTNLQDGIYDSTQIELANPGDGHDRPDATSPDYLILVSDGDPTNYLDPNVDCFPEHDHAEGPAEPDPSYKACKQAARDEALAEAVAAKGNGITIFVLGVDIVGTEGFTAAENEDLLRSIASSPAHYASVDDYSVLETALANLCPAP
ncbi:MAG TPA: VWA domain-containing protein [Candidatus Paceibacterota bacterium]|nr:VWA domain-containing protein [Candidatus Paceibacterota bacterium]